MKITDTLLLIGLGGVIAYLAFGRKSSSPAAPAERGGGFANDSSRGLEAVDVIETQAPINVTVNTPASSLTAQNPTKPVAPQPTTQTAATAPSSTASFVNSRSRRKEGYAERFVILDNTQFPIIPTYNDELDVDSY
jgi:hypothetical protein